MNKYYENAEGQLFVDPILTNHVGLTEITKEHFNHIIAERNTPTTDQLLQKLTQARKEQERQGVTINGIRYAGDPSNRQAMQESLAFMEDAGLAEFTSWKDSDDVFHANHPLADVRNAYRAIGVSRAGLIAVEGFHAAKITAGTLTDLAGLSWVVG